MRGERLNKSSEEVYEGRNEREKGERDEEEKVGSR